MTRTRPTYRQKLCAAYLRTLALMGRAIPYETNQPKKAKP